LISTKVLYNLMNSQIKQKQQPQRNQDLNKPR